METIMSQATTVFFEGLRKQSFSVVLTLAGLVALGWWNVRERSECQASIAALEIEMDSCTSQRLAMAIEVARLRERVNVLASAPVRKK